MSAKIAMKNTKINAYPLLLSPQLILESPTEQQLLAVAKYRDSGYTAETLAKCSAASKAIGHLMDLVAAYHEECSGMIKPQT